MTAAGAPGVDRERGWRKLLPALAGFLFLPLAPPLCLIFPVEQTLVLLLPAVAACAVAGWLAGGRVSVAVFWMALSLLVLRDTSLTLVPASEFDVLVRGWSLVLAASFGVVCLVSRDRSFFGRALSAVGIAALVGTAAVAGAPGGAGHVNVVLSQEFTRRFEHRTAIIEAQAASDDPIIKALRARGEDATRIQRLVSDETAVSLLPALLALESLAALGLAWSLYHRLSRVRIGLPLAPLRKFRFNDQLVWGLVAGVAFMLVASLAGMQVPGLNMLVFFGTLYAVRGMGVLAWFLAPDRLVMVPLVLFAVLAFPLFGAVALGLGLGDTWLDWRSRAARPAA